MQIRKIVVPTDFSDGSEAALATASSLARDNNAKLLIVHVFEPHIIHTDGMAAVYGTLPEALRIDARMLLEQVNPTMPGVDAERRLLSGTPAEAIVQFAEDEKFVDLIVMGTHGRSGLTRVLMGSVAETVVRKAPCPVLTIKEPAKAAAAE